MTERNLQFQKRVDLTGEKTANIDRFYDSNEDEALFSFLPQYQLQMLSLGKQKARIIAKYLDTAFNRLDDDPEKSLEAAKKAYDISPRISITREALGLAYYRLGDYKMAIRELKTVQRILGINIYDPIIADCYRGLGLKDKFDEFVKSRDHSKYSTETLCEMTLVIAGTYVDKGDLITADTMVKDALKDPAITLRLKVRMVQFRARCLEELGKHEQAEHALKSIMISPRNDMEVTSRDLFIYPTDEEDEEETNSN